MKEQRENNVEWKTMADIMRTEYVSKVRHNPENNTLELDIYDVGAPYELDLDQCRDHVELVDWIRHLAKRPDCGADVIYDVIMLWGKITGLSVYGR